MKTTKTIVIATILVFALITVGSCTDTNDDCGRCHPEIVENFETSLHYTATGMYDEYEKHAAGHFGIEMDEYYEKFNCVKCHAMSCTQCHPGSNMYESHLYEVTLDTCEPCHGKKQTSTYIGDMPMHKSQGPNADIHYEAGLLCQDCHAPSELHGNGTQLNTQLEATNVECEGCHKDVSESQSHTVHDGMVDCQSCHTGWILTCQNCHIDTRKGMTVTAEGFLLGRRTDGIVTTFMTMDVTLGNETHHAYGDWYAHTTTAQGKECDFCHNDPAVLGAGLNGSILGEGGSLLSQETVDRILNADTSPERIGFWEQILNLFRC